MAILSIIKFGNKILRQKARPLSRDEILGRDIRELIENLQETADSTGTAAGIAAPQVGESIALTTLDLFGDGNESRERLVLINPTVVTSSDDMIEDWEGCLSLPGVWGKVPRPQSIEVSFLDERAEPLRRTFEGYDARIVQHEIDHLNGVLFIDRMKDMTTLSTTKEAMKAIKREREEEEKSREL
jgi:peptide deformylase